MLAMRAMLRHSLLIFTTHPSGNKPTADATPVEIAAASVTESGALYALAR